MQVGELALQLDDRVVRAGNVAGAAGAGAVGAGRAHARLDDLLVAAHAQVIVRTPHGDFARPVLLAFRTPQGERKTRGVAFEIGEDAIAIILLEFGYRRFEPRSVIHFDLPHALEGGSQSPGRRFYR